MVALFGREPRARVDVGVLRDTATHVSPAVLSKADSVESSLLAGRCILLVEDEPLVRLDTEKRLEAAGARVLGASRLDRALRFADHPDLSAAVLDFDLWNTDSTAVCCRLTDRRIPFVLHSGSVHSAADGSGRAQAPRARVDCRRRCTVSLLDPTHH